MEPTLVSNSAAAASICDALSLNRMKGKWGSACLAVVCRHVHECSEPCCYNFAAFKYLKGRPTNVSAAPILFSLCARCMASCYGNIDIYIYIMLTRRQYNCTDIYIVKYRQSIALRNIYIVGHFLWLARGESYRKTSESGTGRR